MPVGVFFIVLAVHPFHFFDTCSEFKLAVEARLSSRTERQKRGRSGSFHFSHPDNPQGARFRLHGATHAFSDVTC